MKPLKEALFSRKNLNYNPYGLTQKDLKGEIRDFPMGVVVRMMEQQVNQGNKLDVKVFQIDSTATFYSGGFDWDKTEDGWAFWNYVIYEKNFDLFFKEFDEYERYNLS